MTRARDLASSINSTAAGKNFIINGGMDIWQRGTTISAAGSQFVADRWNTYRGGYASGLTVSRQSVADNTNLPGIQYCIRLQRDSGNTATQGIALAHAIESVNSLSLAGKTVTLSFWARAGATFVSSGGQIRPFVLSGTGIDEVPRNGLSNMSYLTNKYLSPTTSWVKYSVTGNVPSNATQVCLSIDGVVVGTAGATDYYEITAVQLEVGSSATPFSRAGGDIQGELAKCQRYFQFFAQTGLDFNFPMVRESATQGVINYIFPTQMRSTPTLYSTTTSYGRVVMRDTAFGIAAGAINGINLYSAMNNAMAVFSVTHGSIAGTYVYSEFDTLGGNTMLAFSAEL